MASGAIDSSSNLDRPTYTVTHAMRRRCPPRRKPVARHKVEEKKKINTILDQRTGINTKIRMPIINENAAMSTKFLSADISMDEEERVCTPNT